MKFIVKRCNSEENACCIINSWGMNKEYEMIVPSINSFRRLIICLHELGHLYFGHHMHDATPRRDILKMEVEAWSYVINALPKDCGDDILHICVPRL